MRQQQIRSWCTLVFILRKWRKRSLKGQKIKSRGTRDAKSAQSTRHQITEHERSLSLINKYLPQNFVDLFKQDCKQFYNLMQQNCTDNSFNFIRTITLSVEVLVLRIVRIFFPEFFINIRQLVYVYALSSKHLNKLASLLLLFVFLRRILLIKEDTVRNVALDLRNTLSVDFVNDFDLDLREV